MKHFLLSLLAIILLAGVIGYVSVRNSNNQLSFLGNQTVSAIPSVVTKTLKENSASINYEINIEYPQIENLPDQNGQKTINQKIAKIVQNLITEFKQELDKNQPDYSEPAMTSGFYVQYEAAQISDSVISFNFTVSDFQEGAAHPNNANLPFNYNVNQQKEIALSNLFKQNSNYLRVISAYSKKDLAVQDKTLDADFSEFIETGAAPEKNNFQKFVVEPTAITFIFDPYQVAPYVAGTRKVTIPLSQLKSVLNSDILQ